MKGVEIIFCKGGGMQRNFEPHFTHFATTSAKGTNFVVKAYKFHHTNDRRIITYAGGNKK